MSPDDRDDNPYDFGDLIDKARDDKAEQDMLADLERETP